MCCPWVVDVLGTRSLLGREKFQGPESDLWETTGFGRPGDVGKDSTALLSINRQHRARESKWR